MTERANETIPGTPEDGPVISGYIPGAVGVITRLHAEWYHRNWNFGIYFETKVASELSALLTGPRSEHNGFWVASVGGAIVGGIAIDAGHSHPSGARLRFFIVDQSCQGLGIGTMLMEKALDFCREKGYGRVFLHTFRGLDAARHIYERKGFVLVEESEDTTWGITVMEQRYELELDRDR